MAFIRDIPISDRPREKLVQLQASSLSNSELLAILLGSGHRHKSALGLAYDLLNKFSLRRLSRASVAELKKMKGIGISKSTSILAAFELARRMQRERKSELKIRGVEDAVEIFQSYIGEQRQEMLAGIFLDSRGNVLNKCIIFVGSISESIVHPREIFKIAINEGAVSIIIAHNHPSGEPSPSAEDISVTKKLRKSGEIFDIVLLDHIIIGDGCYYSFAEEEVW